MQVRSFSKISVKNTAENASRTQMLGLEYQLVGQNIVIDIPENAYKFASNTNWLKKELGF